MMTEKELRELHLRLVAFHEAGHAVVGHYFGYRIEKLKLFPNFDGDIDKEKTWLGNCGHSHSNDPESYSIFGAAGVVAEAIMYGEWETHINKSGGTFEDYKDLNLGASPADEAAIDQAKDLTECFLTAQSILSENWKTVELIANTLMKRKTLTRCEFTELMDSLD